MPIVPVHRASTSATPAPAVPVVRITPNPQLPPSSPDRPSRIRLKVTTPPPAPVTIEPNRDADGDYIVGKNRPPVETRFQPGQSGNPRGRPKGAKGVKTLTIEVLGTRMPVKTAAGEKKMNAAEFSLHKLRELAAKNNLAAILAVLERWQRAVPDIVEETIGSPVATRPASETDRAILDLFAEELRSLSGSPGGDDARR